MIKLANREAWLITLGNTILEEIIEPNIDVKIPKITYSLSPPKTAGSAVVLGECWNRVASPNNDTNAIFISAELGHADSVLIGATLVHELIHAVDNNQNGHNEKFKQLCIRVGLEGGRTKKAANSFTATVAGPELSEHLQEIIDFLGPIPHEALNVADSGKKKQKGRYMKVSCNKCNFKFNTSQTQIDAMKYNDCLVCDHGTLSQEIK